MALSNNSTLNTVVSVAATAAVVYAVYKWLHAQCAPGSGSMLLGTGICDAYGAIFLPSSPAAAAPGASTPAQQQPPVQQQQPPVQSAGGTYGFQTGGSTSSSGGSTSSGGGSTSSGSGSSGGSTATAAANAIAALKAAAGVAQLNFDQWAYYWAHVPAGASYPPGFGAPMSGTLITAVINLGGGDRTKNITADQFVGWVIQAQASGVSGLGDWPEVWMGPAGVGVPVAAIQPLPPSPQWLQPGRGNDIGIPVALVHGGYRRR